MVKDQLSWDQYFRKVAETVALKSKDPRTNIGAVIVNKTNSIISTGYNSLPRGVNDNEPGRLQRPEKHFWFEHAERNAIYNAARIGSATEGAKIYISRWFPCAECTRAIINSGIAELHCEKLKPSDKPSDYDESFKRSLLMLDEADVKVVYYEHH